MVDEIPLVGNAAAWGMVALEPVEICEHPTVQTSGEATETRYAPDIGCVRQLDQGSFEGRLHGIQELHRRDVLWRPPGGELSQPPRRPPNLSSPRSVSNMRGFPVAPCRTDEGGRSSASVGSLTALLRPIGETTRIRSSVYLSVLVRESTSERSTMLYGEPHFTTEDMQ